MQAVTAMKKILILLCSLVFVLTSCEDEYSSLYSTKYRVQFDFDVNGSAELITAMGNPGQYVTVRRKSGTGLVRIENQFGGHDYTLRPNAYEVFAYGLGGLIIGTRSVPNINDQFEPLAYDLACPNCDRPDCRLEIRDNGTAKCGKCSIVYDLNDNGVIVEADNKPKDKVRGLYRYRIIYNGVTVRVFN